jgi:FkbM family methyltransferase
MKKLDIVVWHIGGGDDSIGPADRIVKYFPDNINLILFEARPDSTDVGIEKIKLKSGIDATLVTAGIAGVVGAHNFYVNKFPLSSSLLKPSQQSLSENPNWDGIRDWGENVELKEVLNVTTTTINALLEQGIIPAPNFISIDAQGAEFDILKAANVALKNSVLGLVTECEYVELYEGQGLLHDQMFLLENHGFRLVEIFSSQYWFSKEVFGKGMLTVSENLFFKNIYFGDIELKKPRGVVEFADIPVENLLKLAAISYAFKRYSYYIRILSEIEKRMPKKLLDLSKEINISKVTSPYYRFKNLSPAAKRRLEFKHKFFRSLDISLKALVGKVIDPPRALFARLVNRIHLSP